MRTNSFLSKKLIEDENNFEISSLNNSEFEK